MSYPPAGQLVLVPWHIGHLGDLTQNALAACRDMPILLCEDPEGTRGQLAELGVDCSAKEVVRVGFDVDPTLLERCLAHLATEDVGLVSDGGVPCFVDPGAWLVAAVRARGHRVRVLAGASALAAALAASGIPFEREDATFTFHLYEGSSRDPLPRLLTRSGEPVLVFVRPEQLRDCLAAAERASPKCRATLLVDLTKTSSPYADQVLTRTVREWRHGALDAIDLQRVSDLSVLFQGQVPRQGALGRSFETARHVGRRLCDWAWMSSFLRRVSDRRVSDRRAPIATWDGSNQDAPRLGRCTRPARRARRPEHPGRGDGR